MENVYHASKAIILFLVIMLVIETVFGDKTAQKMAIFILFSMLILNAGSWSDFLSAVTNNITSAPSGANTDTDRSTTHTGDSGQTHGGGSKSF